MTSSNHIQSATLFFNQFSYHNVRTSLWAIVILAAVSYVGLVIMSTVTITHSKALVQDIQNKQGIITELNGELAAKNQNLAEKLKTSDTYAAPVKTAYIKRGDVITPALALEQ